MKYVYVVVGPWTKRPGDYAPYVYGVYQTQAEAHARKDALPAPERREVWVITSELRPS